MASHLDRIIKLMGYADAESSCLKYGRDGFSVGPFAVHTAKILEELSPYAVYMVDDEPFVLFYEELSDKVAQKQLYKKIWNAQIPVAIVCDPGTVRIYNGCSIDKEKSLLVEVECIPVNEINEHSPFSYWEITSQDMWVNCAPKFSGEKLNDCLLRNLSDITEKLKKEYKIQFATKLVLRLIFIRYLIDRGVDLDYAGFSSHVESSQGALLSLLTDKKKLYSLFEHLKNKFNGNLFELENEIDNENLTEDVFRLLSDFLSANIDTKTGQLSFFDLYDFNIIPVELISNIYEILLGKEGRDKDNAFYTPRYLVDYILDGSVSTFVRDKGICKVLDPSCGSGIFLVESYRRMIEKELDGKHFTENDDLLKSVLTENIYGVDLNPDAVDVAIFSLYLAVLDYKNPRTLNSFKLPNLKGNNLFAVDFFNETALLPLQIISFDFIIGNPPWGKGNQLLEDYCTRKGYQQYLQNRDTCRAFILRSKDFCTDKTHCCFVLHSKMLYMQKQPSKAFREYFLTNAEIIRIIELSSVRKLIFKNADAPAVIISYRFSDNNVLRNRFEYISMKPNIFFKLFNIIVVEKTDVKHVQQKLLKEHDWAWKTIVYGLTGDIDAIMQLKKGFPTIKQAMKEHTPKLLKGTGVQYNDGDKNDASHLVGRPFLDSDAIDHFSIDLDCLGVFEKAQIHRPRDERLFHAPYCLMLTGIDMSDYTMRSVYSDVDFIFREVIYAIKGNIEQKSFLLNLTGLFNSKVFAYFNLMLGSFVGIEREKRLVDEVLSFPYVYNESIANQVERIQALQVSNDAALQADISAGIAELNQTILEAFRLSDDEFVDYALRIQIPQLSRVNDHDVYRHVSEQDLKVYGQYFYHYLSNIFSRTNKYIKTVAYPKVAQHYSVFEVMVQEEQPKEWFQVSDSADNKEILAMLSAHKINDKFYHLKDTLYFTEHSFCIVKPNHYKNWHPAIAKLDLMDTVDQILSRNGGNA